MTAESLFLNAPVHRTVSAGEVDISPKGMIGTHMYGVVSGAVELRKGAVVVASLGPNDVFGERALIDHLPRSLTRGRDLPRRSWPRSTAGSSCSWFTRRRRSRSG